MSLLPTQPVVSKPDPIRLKYLFIGPPKWGKTTWMMNIPDALLLAFEEGHAFQSGYKIIIDAWEKKGYEAGIDEQGATHMTMQQAMRELQASDRFPFVIFDTADMAAKMCADFHCKELGIKHPQDAGDYGKGYAITQNDPFRQMVLSLMKTGRGIGFISHSDVATTKFAKGEKAKKTCTLPGGVYKFLHTQADVILHGSFGEKQPGVRYRSRVLQTEGDEETLAGSRVKGISLPSKYIVDPSEPWQQWCRFFNSNGASEAAEQDFATLQTEEPEPEGTTETAVEPETKKKVKK